MKHGLNTEEQKTDLYPCSIRVHPWLKSSFSFASLLFLLLTGVVASAQPAVRWWKGNLHTHTLWSDGDDFPEMVVDWYKSRGYDFLALSDHNTLQLGAVGVVATNELTVRAPRGVVRLKVSGVLVDSARPHGVLTLDRGLFQRHWGGETADAFHLFLAPGHEAATVRAALEASLKERPGIRVLTHADFKRALARVIDDTLGLAKVQAVAAAAVAWITLVNILLLQVERRKVEIAVLRVIGATPAQIVRLVWVESILLVLVGALLGALLGFALSWVSTLVVGAVHVGWRVPYRFDPALLAWLLPGALVAAALAALGPGRRAAREPITRAILGD